MSTPPTVKGWPVEIRYAAGDRCLKISFDDGSAFSLPAEYLRVESPSAEVQGHGAGPKKCVAGRRDVAITLLEPVGRYAVRILFDDGHDTGIFSWRYLRTLGSEHRQRWGEYLRRLDIEGLTRDP